MTDPFAPTSTAALPAAAPTASPQLVKAAKAFEAIFTRQMISTMRSGQIGDDLFGSTEGDTFRDMSDARMADDMTTGKGMGIADLLLRQFLPKVIPPLTVKTAK
jgi:peptidoglycan hydrolase FlgJ